MHKIIETVFIVIKVLLFVSALSYIITVLFARNLHMEYWSDENINLFLFFIVFICLLFGLLIYFSYGRKE